MKFKIKTTELIKHLEEMIGDGVCFHANFHSYQLRDVELEGELVNPNPDVYCQVNCPECAKPSK